MAALLPQPDMLELLTPLLVAASLAIVVIVIHRVVSLTRSMRAKHGHATPTPSDTVTDYPLNPLEERKTKPWKASDECDAIPLLLDPVDSSANTAPISLDPTAARSR